MKKTTVENKSQLAKLLATENIEVQENAVQTASFDVKDRILTIPIFKEEHKSKHVYDMLGLVYLPIYCCFCLVSVVSPSNVDTAEPPC